jgi:uncharacterized protein (DUF362 family)
MNLVITKKISNIDEDVRKILEELRWRDIVQEGGNVLIKPNFLTEPKAGVTTDLNLLKCVIEVVKERTNHVIVGETDSTGRSFDKVMESLDLNCPVINLSRGPKRLVKGKHGSYLLPSQALDSKIINIPVLKTHVLTRVSLGLKNLFGLLPDREKEPYHWKISRTLCDLYEIFMPEINILDATYAMDGEGPSKGRVRKAGFIAGSTDAFALDLGACEIIGIDAKEIDHLNFAMKHRLVEYKISGDDVFIEDFHVPKVKLFEKLLAFIQHYPTRKILRLFRNDFS